MGSRKKFKAVVIVFDVNSEDSFKEEAVKYYLTICGNRYFTSNLDCSQLILINTAETLNKKNEEDSNKYKNIVEATTMSQYKLSDVKYIKEAAPAQGNWIEGIEVAVEELISSTTAGVFDTYQLIMLSDLSTPLQMEHKDISKAVKNIRRQLNDIDGYIYFLGPTIPVSKMLRTKKDVYDWMQNLDVQDKSTNIQIAARILEECSGVICDMEMGTDLVEVYLNNKRGYPFTEPLRFGELEIITACYKFLDCQSMLTLRREVDGFKEKVFVDGEDQSIEVDPSNVIRGIALHNRLVIIPPDVTKGIKEYNRFFKLLGFTDQSNVPEDYMLASSTNLVTCYDTRDPEIGAINYVIQACLKLKKYAITLRAYMKNTRPKLYCLIPKEEPLCFIAVELPYAEDMHILYESKDPTTSKFKEDSYPDYGNVPQLKEDIYAYLDAIDIEGKVKLHPSLRQNFNKMKTISNLIRKVNGEEVEEIQLPVGDLRVEAPEKLCEAINQNWFPKNQEMDVDEVV